MPVDVKEFIEDGQLDISILEDLEHAQKAPEPGDFKATKQQDKLSGAGYCYIYDRITGQRSVTNRNMLPAQLKKRREDGSRVFTVRDPHKPQRQGAIKCLLHHDDPNRAKYDLMGFPVCPMEHIPSPFELENHMAKRHKKEWAGIQRERQMEREKRQEDFQTALMNRIAGQGAPEKNMGSEDAPLYVKPAKSR